MPTPKIYALIVAIDDYPRPVPKLQGCLNDANAVKAYLEKRFKDSLVLKTLFDTQATRLNVLQTFDAHLGQASKEDIALFYYVGHGSQEATHPTFAEIEPDGKNETLVCYDSRVGDGLDLADKEMAAAIDKVAKKCNNVVTIFDCCHSGGVTRDITNDTVERSLDEFVRDSEYPARVRPWDSYILSSSDDTQGRAVINADTKYIVPTPRHIALTAALSTQTAKETTLGRMRRGVFTFNLINLLDASPVSLSYTDIINQLRAMVANKVSDQTPQLDVEVPDDADKFFLNSAQQPDTEGYLLYFDSKTSNTWELNGGALMNIQPNSKIAIFPATATNLRNFAAKLGTGTIQSATAATANVIPNINLDTTLMYKAMVMQSNVNKLKVAFNVNDSAYSAVLQNAFNNSPTANMFLSLMQSAADADYMLFASNGKINIGKKLDGVIGTRGIEVPALPLTAEIAGLSAENADKAVARLEHIARWQNTLDLGNPASSFSPTLFPMTVYQVKGKGADETKTPIGLQLIPDPKTGKNRLSNIAFSYNTDTNLPRFQISVQNKANQRVYVSLLLISSQFGIVNCFPSGGYWLNPGEICWSRKGALNVPLPLRAMGRKETTENYKLIVSTEEFDATLLLQDDLDLYIPPASRGVEKGLDKLLSSVQDRAVTFDDEGDTGGATYDWTTQIIQMKVKYTGV